MKRDYYEILGIKKDSTVAQIKKAYRSLALKHHPDRVEESKKKESEETFKEISEAYGVLSDPKKRKMYDQYGHAGIDQQFTSEDIFRGADFSSIFEGSGLGDIFSQFFGGDAFGGGQSRGPQRGNDIQYEANVTLQEAFSGVEKQIKIPRDDLCETCNGSGAKPGTELKTCQTCKGQGQVIVSSGFFRMQQTCSTCSGRGKIIVELCPKCHGRGVFRVTRNIKVNIPAGVDSNSRLRISGEGEIGQAGPGDLYLYLNVVPHEVFQRDGDNIYLQKNVSFITCALGGEVSVETLNGSVSMKVPQSTQSGKVFRLKNKGMPSLRGGYTGDQYVKVMIEVPNKLSIEQRKLLEEFAKISGEKFSPKEDSLKDKIKKVFK